MSLIGQEMAPKRKDAFRGSFCWFDMNFCLWISAAFFQDCISEQDLDEMNIEIIRNTLYKVKQIIRRNIS